MITLQEFLDSTKKENASFHYGFCKSYYISNIAPIVRHLHNLVKEHGNLFSFCSTWVTDYGEVNGYEKNDDVLINIFTYNGHVMDELYTYVGIDLAWACDNEKFVNQALSKRVQDIMGMDFYDEHWYRFESNDATEICDFVVKIQTIIHIIKMEEKKNVNMGKKNIGSIVNTDDTLLNSTYRLMSILVTRGVQFTFIPDLYVMGGSCDRLVIFKDKRSVQEIVMEADKFQDFNKEQIVELRKMVMDATEVDVDGELNLTEHRMTSVVF